MRLQFVVVREPCDGGVNGEPGSHTVKREGKGTMDCRAPHNSDVLSPHPGGQKSELKVSAGRVPPEAVRENRFPSSLASHGLGCGVLPVSSFCACLSVSECLPFTRTQSHQIRAHPSDLILT